MSKIIPNSLQACVFKQHKILYVRNENQKTFLLRLKFYYTFRRKRNKIVTQKLVVKGINIYIAIIIYNMLSKVEIN